MNNTQQAEEKRFVEDFGIAFEQTGLSRMAGRIVGCLLITNPPHQSAEQLAEALQASKGSISTMTRLLIQLGMIERLSLPGVRHCYFQLQPDVWQRITKHGLEDEIKLFHQLAERGLKLTSRNTLAHKGLEGMHNIYTFLEREFPALLERWDQRPKNKSPKK